MAKARKSNGRGAQTRGFARRISGRGPAWTVLLRWLTFLGVAGILAGALTFFALYQVVSIPSENAAFTTQTTKVYYSDGKHLIGEFAEQDRESIALDQIPAVMQAAVIAAEDRSFYTNRGLDFKGILRALRNNAQAGEVTSGGSTITQQYVKILYLTQERTYTRKIKEAILALKIHNQLSKQEILQGYLNTIYFGNGAYGVEVAAQTYFDKPASKLNFPQAAALATIINSPSYYDPYVEGGPERMLARYEYVLDGMVKSGAITSEDREVFRGRLPKFAEQKDSNRFAGTKGYLLETVKKQLLAQEFTEAQLVGQGLRITTTFDHKSQKAAVAAMKAQPIYSLKELHGALVAVQPGTGAVRAMYGGKDFLKSQINWATVGTQPGSTFKPFAVIAALEDGYSLKTQLNGSSPLRVGPQDTPIENQGDSGGQSFGKVSLERATEKSINTAFVDLTMQMAGGPDEEVTDGAEKVLQAAEDAGIPASITDKIDPIYVTSLGYAPVPPVDMANAYATIAAQGERAQWYVIESVKDRFGTELHKHEAETEQTIPEDVAADTIAAMRNVVSKGTGTRARTVCATAGKTGTATAGSNDDQHVSSSWFAGYTPKLAAVVMYNRGVGNEALDGYMNPFYGGTYPAATFKAFMDAALDASNCGTFPKPANIKSDKGTEYKSPTPKPKPTLVCRDGYQLQADKLCHKIVTATPSPEAPKCDDNPNNAIPPCETVEPTPTCTPELLDPCGPGNGGGNNGWVFVLPLSLFALAPLRRWSAHGHRVE